MAAVCMLQAAGALAGALAGAPAHTCHPRRGALAASTTSRMAVEARRSPLVLPCRRRALILPRASHRAIEDAEARPGG